MEGTIVSKIRRFLFSQKMSREKFEISPMMVGGNGGHHFSMISYSIKILIWGLRGMKSKNGKYVGITHLLVILNIFFIKFPVNQQNELLNTIFEFSNLLTNKEIN